MLLKVGELAKRTGVTVRALHHYDSIGLLRPSSRSDAGYRLYNRDDIARLHGIQTLRQLGVPLADVARLLDGGAASLSAILARQISALDLQIERGRDLRDRLDVMQLVLARGDQPQADDWLASLATMSTMQEHFSAKELKRTLQRLRQCADDWPALVQAVRAAMAQGVRPDSVQIQPLVRQWADLVTRWMDGDMGLLDRWGTMLREQSALPLPFGMDRALLDYIDQAVRHRVAVIARYADPDQLQRILQHRPRWHALAARTQCAITAGVTPRDSAGRALGREWLDLLDGTFGPDVAMRERVLSAFENEPLLRASNPMTPALRHYLEAAAAP